MRIVSLTAENVKRLRAVEITPDGNVVTITGRNAQGKTSVLDAIWLALGGGAAAKGTVRPIRDGEDHASVTLDLGDVVVTRTWRGERTTLTVTSADGAKYASPQGMLDSLVGRLSFDPLEFTRLRPLEQRQALLDLVDLPVDIDALDRNRRALFDQRTAVGREGKSVGVVSVDASLPEAETSASQLVAQIREAQEIERLNHDERHMLERARQRVDATTAEIGRLTTQLERDAEALSELEATVATLPAIPDVAAIEAALAGVEETNAAIRANNSARERSERVKSLRAEYDRLTAEIGELDRAKAAALANADLPVPGLGFDDGSVTFHGVPFSQASSAEQIRVSLAMAMALNPKLRVIRILDGSLLDAENLALVAEAADANDYQVWVERVADSTESAVVIEDGEVLS